MNNKLLRTLIGSLSFTTALFVFQACYGTPQAVDNDFLVEGQVTSRTSGQPVQNIRVGIEGDSQHQYTDSDGRFSFYTVKRNNIKLVFEDSEEQPGNFAKTDTLINGSSDTVCVNISLVEE